LGYSEGAGLLDGIGDKLEIIQQQAGIPRVRLVMPSVDTMGQWHSLAVV